MVDDVWRALLPLHLQNEVVDPDGYIGRRGIATVVAERGVIAAAARARQDFAEAGEPVLHVVFERPASADTQWSTAPQLREVLAVAFTLGGWGVQPHRDPLRPGDEPLVHHTMSAFAGTGLRQLLADRGVSRVVLAGVSTTW